MVLDRIVARTRARLEERKRQVPLEALYEGLAPSDRDFRAALSGPAPAFILEVKPRSPSAGVLRAPDDLSPVIASYGRHADAVSVLTEPEWFGGSPGLLRRVRRAVSQPVLAKDFIVDPYQVVEARAHGADAVLLMLTVLDDATYHACVSTAARLGMGVLTEVHTAPEMQRARAFRATVVGINNRDLATLRVDLGVTAALAAGAPPGAVLIAESGVGDHAAFGSLRHLVDGALVGTALMRAPDVDRAVRHLVYGETKVCGLTSVEDACSAQRAGVTHGGLVFHPASPRAVTASRARELASVSSLAWVGVFVNEVPEQVAHVARSLRLAAVQLHGEETGASVARLRELLPVGTEIWKAARVREGRRPRCDTAADLVLLDTFHPLRHGGTGQPFDWSVLDTLDLGRAFGVAGGLTPHNVGQVVHRGERLVDVSSGVEVAPGRKDAALVGAFLRARRGVRRVGAASPVREARVA